MGASHDVSTTISEHSLWRFPQSNRDRNAQRCCLPSDTARFGPDAKIDPSKRSRQNFHADFDSFDGADGVKCTSTSLMSRKRNRRIQMSTLKMTSTNRMVTRLRPLKNGSGSFPRGVPPSMHLRSTQTLPQDSKNFVSQIALGRQKIDDDRISKKRPKT